MTNGADAVAQLEAPIAFVALAVNVYVAPGVNPVNVTAPPPAWLTVIVFELGVDVIVYD